MTTRVGFIGLGRMGLPMCYQLLQAGFDLTVHNRSQDKVKRISQDGAWPAQSAAEVTQHAEILLACLPDIAAVEEVFLGVHYLITRRRTIPDISSRAPEKALALKETLLILAYGATVLILGQIIGRLVSGEGIGFHLHGSVFGAAADTTPGAVIGWSAYNFVAYAVIPYVVFRMRAYGHEALSLKSSNVKNDALLLLVILAIGVALGLATTNIFDLTGSQVLLGLPLTFAIYLFGTDIPVMVFLILHSAAQVPKAVGFHTCDGYSWWTDLRRVAHLRIPDSIRHLKQFDSFRAICVLPIHRTWNGEILSYIKDRECVGARMGLSCNFPTSHRGHAKHC